jgi:hypothetical protein
MKSLFNPEVHQEVINRIETLNENSSVNWGKMNVGQMTWHCQGPFNIMLQKNDYGMKPSWFAKVLFKKSLYNDKPWRKNLPTAKFLKAKEDKDLNTEKAKLVGLINEVNSHRNKTEWEPHPAFGYFTAEQWGQMQYKHLDHHLKQFNA